MAKNSLVLSLLRTVTLIIIAFLHLLSPVACFAQKQSTDTTRDLLFEGKSRLGSTPPSCHNKCNQCHPCFAVQVPTMPSHDRSQPGLNRVAPMEFFDTSSTSSFSNKYSNYKPLGWKCRCRDHFFNP